VFLSNGFVTAKAAQPEILLQCSKNPGRFEGWPEIFVGKSAFACATVRNCCACAVVADMMITKHRLPQCQFSVL
jgi:hypothetical protein